MTDQDLIAKAMQRKAREALQADLAEQVELTGNAARADVDTVRARLRRDGDEGSDNEVVRAAVGALARVYREGEV